MTAKHKNDVLNQLHNQLDVVEKKIEVLTRRRAKLHDKLKEVKAITPIG